MRTTLDSTNQPIAVPTTPATPVKASVFRPVPRQQRPLLVFRIDVGHGHNKMADSVEGRMRTSDPKMLLANSVMFNNHMKKAGGLFFGKGYARMAQYTPLFYRFLYFGMPKITSAGLRRQALSWLFKPELAQALAQENPGLFICPHPWLADTVDIYKERGELPLDAKVVSVVTDFSVTELYNTRGLIIVPHEALKEQLVAMGKEASMIRVVRGLPARPEFLQPYDQRQVRLQLDKKLAADGIAPGTLSGDEPLFVAAGGGEAIKLPEVVKHLKKWQPSRPVKVVVICGENVSLRKKLDRLIASGKLHKNLTVISRGFEKEMHLYMKAADVILSKPGGATLAECMALGQTLAVHSYIKGQEEKNFALMKRLGTIVPIKLRELNDVDALLTRTQVARAAMVREFPNPDRILAEIERHCVDYVNGAISDAAREVKDLEDRAAKNFFRKLRSPILRRMFFLSASSAVTKDY